MYLDTSNSWVLIRLVGRPRPAIVHIIIVIVFFFHIHIKLYYNKSVSHKSCRIYGLTEAYLYFPNLRMPYASRGQLAHHNIYYTDKSFDSFM